MSDTLTDVEITMDDISAAQAGEGWAQELVLGAMADRIGKLAGCEARKWYGQDYGQHEDEFKSAANIAVWEALGRFTGTSVDSFFAFMFRTAETSVTTHANEMRYPGADADAIQVFAYWLRQTDGDLLLAEKLCQRSADPIGRRLGRDRANAARLAVTGSTSLDAPAPAWQNDGTSGTDITYADMLVSDQGIPDEFITSDDLSRRDRSVRNELVHAVLDSMGELSSDVLRMTFGVEPCGEYGVSANDEIGAACGRTAKQVIDARTKGYRQFAKKFIPLVAGANEVVAAGWWEAFEAERGKSNARVTKA